VFFADADRFRTRVKQLVQEDGALTGVVVDAESVFLTDTDGADIRSQVAAELRAQGTSLVLARVHPAALELWRRAGAIDAIGGDRVFESVSDAVYALSPVGGTSGTGVGAGRSGAERSPPDQRSI
jgi:MFS superfamily sulfate permease-like transporter